MQIGYCNYIARTDSPLAVLYSLNSRSNLLFDVVERVFIRQVLGISKQCEWSTYGQIYVFANRRPIQLGQCTCCGV